MAEETLTRDDYVFLAKVQESAELFKDMAASIKKVVEEGSPLNIEERNLLSVAYKNIIGTCRSAWRTFDGVEQREREKGHTRQVALLEPYRKKIEDELDSISSEILKLLSDILIPGATTQEAQCFYLKMKGDYHRYVAEYKKDAARDDAAKEASAAYKEATELASVHLAPTHPIRLGLALNYSVFNYEILQDTEKACSLARTAFDDAIARLDSVSDDAYKDATLILQLLRDNLSLWVGDANNEEDEE